MGGKIPGKCYPMDNPMAYCRSSTAALLHTDFVAGEAERLLVQKHSPTALLDRLVAHKAAHTPTYRNAHACIHRDAQKHRPPLYASYT